MVYVMPLRQMKSSNYRGSPWFDEADVHDYSHSALEGAPGDVRMLTLGLSNSWWVQVCA